MSESIRHVIREIYCEVLFELAEETDKIDHIQSDLEKVRAVLQQEREFSEIMNSLTISGKDKSESLRRIFSGYISNLALDFLCVLARRNRMGFLSGITDRYEMLVDRYHNRQPVEVTVAKEPSPEQVEKLKMQLSEAIKGEVKLSINVDEEIIGGIIIQKDDTVVDNSVRRALQRAAHAVAQNVVMKKRTNPQ